MWAKDYECCTKCETTEIPVMAAGVCRRCYLKQYRADNAQRIAAQKKEWYERFVAGTDIQKQKREQRNFDGMRSMALDRDGHRCVRCGSTHRLIVHHKDHEGRGSEEPNNDLHNLETLCRKCHINEHREDVLAPREAAGFPRPRLDRWSRRWLQCRRCMRTDRKHSAHGYCRTCINWARQNDEATPERAPVSQAVGRMIEREV